MDSEDGSRILTFGILRRCWEHLRWVSQPRAKGLGAAGMGHHGAPRSWTTVLQTRIQSLHPRFPGFKGGPIPEGSKALPKQIRRPVLKFQHKT